MWMLKSLERLVWNMVREVGEQKAEGLVRGFVADLNAEAAELRESGEVEKLLEDVPVELRSIIAGILWRLVDEKLEGRVQELVDKLWAKAQAINPSDETSPAPNVDLDGDDGDLGDGE